MMIRLSLCLAALILLLTSLWSGSTVRADDQFWPDWQPRTNGTIVVRQFRAPSGPVIDNGMEIEFIGLDSGGFSILAGTAVWEDAPDIDGSWVVWREALDPLDAFSCRSKIVAKNLTTGSVTTLAAGLVAPTAPRISGDFVIWGARDEACSPDGTFFPPTGAWSITVFDLSRMEPVRTVGPISNSVSTPVIDGSRIIWGQSSALASGRAEGVLMYLDLDAGELPAKLGVALVTSYDISGDYVVYAGSNEQLEVVDLTNMTATVVDPGPVDAVTIDNGVIAWSVRIDSDSWELRGYSLESDERYELDSSSAPIQPHLGGGTLVWQADFGPAIFGVKSAPASDFKRLHALHNGNDVFEFLLWGGAILAVIAAAAIAWRTIRSGQLQTLRTRL